MLSKTILLTIIFLSSGQLEDEIQPSDDNYDGFFESVEIPRSDVVPMLNRKDEQIAYLMVFRGERVSVAEHPYVVSVRRLFSHYLTGTLLTKNLVITVAHPLYLVNPSTLGVVAGESFADRGSIMLTVVVVVIHPDFEPSSLTADIALLRLYEDVIYKVSVKPISLLSPVAELDGRTAFVTGWGRCDRTGKELCLPRSSAYYQEERFDPMLRTIKFTARTGSRHCSAYAVHSENIAKGMLCVGPARADELMCACMAVPGAPLVVAARLAGFQSWGFGCGYAKDLPLMYTDVRTHLGWLIHNIPIMKTLSKNNLTELFMATKMQVLSEWLSKTRIRLPPIRKLPIHDIQAVDVDYILSRIKGNIYDVRDFINGGEYHKRKENLYDSLRISYERANVIKEAGLQRMMNPKPFLSNDSIDTDQFVEQNGSLYYNDTNGDEEYTDEYDVDVTLASQ